jgi:hypothetical protein
MTNTIDHAGDGQVMPLAVTVAKACELSGFGPTSMWAFLKDGRLKAVRVPGVRRTLVSYESLALLLSPQSDAPLPRKRVRPRRDMFDFRRRLDELTGERTRRSHEGCRPVAAPDPMNAPFTSPLAIDLLTQAIDGVRPLLNREQPLKTRVRVLWAAAKNARRHIRQSYPVLKANGRSQGRPFDVSRLRQKKEKQDAGTLYIDRTRKSTTRAHQPRRQRIRLLQLRRSAHSQPRK